MNKLWSTLRSRLGPNDGTDKNAVPSPRREPASSTATAPGQRNAPDPPPELPALHLSPPLESPGIHWNGATATEQPRARDGRDRSDIIAQGSTKRDAHPLPPPLPHLETLRVTDYAASVTPPTPVDASSSSHPDSTFSVSRPSTPPSSEPSLQPAGAAAVASPLHAPSSPSLTPNDLRGINALAQRERRHHRRSSSTGSRSFRETLNAYSVEDADGRRSVNQYVLGETLGRGSYATVEKAVDRETGDEYVSPLSSLTAKATLLQ